MVFLREEEEGPFVPFYHERSITLREIQETFHVSSVLECDQGGYVHPRAVAFDSPSDVLRSGRHYVARKDSRMADQQGGNRVTFKSKILVKEYDLEADKTPSTVASSSPPSGSLARSVTPYRPLTARCENTGGLLGGVHTPGAKRQREDEEPVPSASLRFIPFSADLDGSGRTALVTVDVLRELCRERVQEERYHQQHAHAEKLLSSARQLFIQEEELQ